MKIGLVLSHFDPSRGGLERWTWDHATRLRRAGVEVTVVACTFHPDAQALGVEMVACDPGRTRWESAKSLADRTKTIRVDLVHEMGESWCGDIVQPHGGVTAAYYSRVAARIPRWRRVPGLRPKGYRDAVAIERRRYARTDFTVAAVSQLVADDVMSGFGLDPARVEVIHNAVDTERFAPAVIMARREEMRSAMGFGNDEHVIGFVGHRPEQKGGLDLLRAVAAVSQKGLANWNLLVAGRAGMGGMKRLAARLGISGRVRFLGQIEDIVDMYAACDSCALPTYADPCALTTLEASSCGIPVITTRADGSSERLEDGVSGIVLERAGDVGSLTAALAGLAGDPIMAARIGEGGRRVAEGYSAGDMFEKYLALYGLECERRGIAV